MADEIATKIINAHDSCERPSAFAILLINPTATEKEIDSSFRKLSKLVHPDKNDSDEKYKLAFQYINEAHTRLKEKHKSFRDFNDIVAMKNAYNATQMTSGYLQKPQLRPVSAVHPIMKRPVNFWYRPTTLPAAKRRRISKDIAELNEMKKWFAKDKK